MARVKFLSSFRGRALAWRCRRGYRRDSGCIFMNARDAMAMAVTAHRFVFVALLSGQPACLVLFTFTSEGLYLQTQHELLVPPLLPGAQSIMEKQSTSTWLMPSPSCYHGYYSAGKPSLPRNGCTTQGSKEGSLY